MDEQFISHSEKDSFLKDFLKVYTYNLYSLILLINKAIFGLFWVHLLIRKLKITHTHTKSCKDSTGGNLILFKYIYQRINHFLQSIFAIIRLS